MKRSRVIRAGQYASALGMLIALARLSGGCSSTNDPAVSSSNDPILGGTLVTAAQFPQLVTVGGVGGGCTGTLLSDRWVLTARHCVPGAHVTPAPASPTMNVTHAALGTSAVTAAYYMPGTYTLDIVKGTTTTPQTDVALLRLTTPFLLDLTNRQSVLHLYPYANAGLANTTQTCAGRGWTALNTPAAGMNVNNVFISSTTPRLITALPNASGSAIQAPGDSGGPCQRLAPGGAWWLFRVQSGATVQQNDAGQVTSIGTSFGAGTESFRHWALATMGLGVGLFSDAGFSGAVQTIAFSTGNLLLGNDTLSSIRVPTGWTVRLWEHNPPSGAFLDVTGDLSNMPAGWNDRASYVELVDGGVRLFSDSNFQGTSQMLSPGRYDVNVLAAGIGNDTLSSIRIPLDWRVKLYTDAGFSGSSITLYATDLGNFGAWNSAWNDNVSSIVIEQPAYAYEHANWAGVYQPLWEGNFNAADLLVGNDAISSVWVPSHLKMQVYEHGNFRGQTAVLPRDFSVGDAWNDRISSIRMTGP